MEVQGLNKVEICGVDTAKLPMLTAKETRELLLKVKSGDEAAREEFIRSNLRLVLSIVQRFSNRSEMMDDLFQVGCIGSSRPSTTSTCAMKYAFPPMPFQ